MATAKLHGLLSEVVHSGTSLGKLRGLCSEVIWQDRAYERAEPRSFILFQDAKLSGSAVISSTTVTSQDGAFLSSSFAGSLNEGDLVPFVSGSWETSSSTAYPAPEDLLLQVLRTGSLYNSSEWGWRYASDGSDQHRGMDDLRWLHAPHCPFGDAADKGSAFAICVSKVHNKVIVGYHPYSGSTSTSNLAYVSRSLSVSDPTAWSAVTTMDMGGARAPATTGYSTMWELPDGALRWAYSYIPDGNAAPTTYEIDILGSVDGGVTWTLVKEKVVSELFGQGETVHSFKVACSGDWMRLDMWVSSVSPFGLVSAVSSDRAATWKLVAGVGVGDGQDDTLSNTDLSGKTETWDTCPVDDSGNFLRVRGVIAPATDLQFQMATRDGAWIQISNTTAGTTFQAPKTGVVNVMCARGGGRSWVLVFKSDHHSGASGIDEWSMASFIIPEPLITRGWKLISPRVDRWARWGGNDWLSYEGTARVHPKGAVLRWAGDRLALLSGGVDRQTSTSTTGWQTPSMRYLGGASRRSLRMAQSTNSDLMNQFLDGSWSSAIGSVGGTGPKTSSFSPWNEGNSGSPTVAWTPAYQRAGTGVASTITWARSQTLVGATRVMADSGVVGWATRAEPGTIPPTAYPPGWTAGLLRQPRWGAHVQSESLRTAGLTLDVSVHIDGQTGRFAMYDISGLNTLYEAPAGALAGITSGTWYDFRLGMAHSFFLERAGTPTLLVELGWAKHGDNQWSSTGLLTITGGSPLTSAAELVLFGHSSTATGPSSVDWREWFYRRDSHLCQAGFSNPDKLRGWSCQPHSVRVGQAHDILWGGAGGFKGDTFTCPAKYEYGIGQMLTDSPANVWQSTTSETQFSVFDATLINSEPNATFVHSAFAGISTNSRYLWVDYSTSSSFTNPARIVVDGIKHTVQAESIAMPFHVKASGGWQDGELSGNYLRAEPSGGFPNPPILRIDSNNGSWLHLAGMSSGASLTSCGISAGATLHIWGDQHLHSYNDWPEGIQVLGSWAGTVPAFPRYMKLTIPGASVQGEPPGGKWHLGRVQAGLTLPINVPLSWSGFEDDEVPNIEIDTADSGVRTAYEAGPPRRKIKGTSVGDVDRWRIAFRSMIKKFARYSASPVVLCVDDQNMQNMSVYCRFTGTSKLNNAGWKFNDETSKWEQVGDLSVEFEQEV